MQVFFELRYAAIIKLVRTFYLKNVPAKFQKYLKHFLSYQRDKFVKTVVQPWSSLPEHQLQPSWRRIFSSSNNQKTRVDSDINSDCRAYSFDWLYIWGRKWDTASFVRAHQRKYWNALTVGRGRDDNGCSCNHRAVPPSALVSGWALLRRRFRVPCTVRITSRYGRVLASHGRDHQLRTSVTTCKHTSGRPRWWVNVVARYKKWDIARHGTILLIFNCPE